MSSPPREHACLLSPVLDAHVMELVDCMGFHLLSHIPEQAAHLRLGDADLLLRQDSSSTDTSSATPGQVVRLWVSGFFEIYAMLASKLRHRLSGPPRLSSQGEWEFSVPDSFGHTLNFCMSSAERPSAKLMTGSSHAQSGAKP